MEQFINLSQTKRNNILVIEEPKLHKKEQNISWQD
jgi:hypothetical protein